MTIAEQIARVLEGLGKPYEALIELAEKRQLFVVGGTVRDVIMGRTPMDFDFAVSGSGIELAGALAKKIRGRYVLLSELEDQARVVYRKMLTLDFNGFGDQTIQDDLERRDFTVNAIALQIAEHRQGVTPRRGDTLTLIDPFGGQKAIAEKRLIPVSAQSLEMDPLRLLRAMRFALELGFEMDEEIGRQAARIVLTEVAAERIGYELMRIMACDGSHRFMALLYKLGFLHQIFPEAIPLLGDKRLMRHSMGTYRKLEQLIHRRSYFSAYEPEHRAYFEGNPHQSALLKLAGLLHDIGKPETEFINERNEVHFYGHDALGAKYVEAIARKRLRLSRDDTKALKTLVEYHMRPHLLATGPELTDRAVRRYFRDLGGQYLGLMMLAFADGFATAGATRHLEEKFGYMIGLKREYDAVIRIERLVTGDDLIALGMKPGPAFKTILAELEELQIEGKIMSKEAGLDYVKNKSQEEWNHK